jgi:hypothetical protein
MKAKSAARSTMTMEATEAATNQSNDQYFSSNPRAPLKLTSTIYTASFASAADKYVL